MSLPHTPGPWRLENNIAYGWKTNPYSITVRKPGVHGVAVANIPAKQTISRDEALANARLMAAAPELLEAVKYIANCCQLSLDDPKFTIDETACDLIRAAIAKAKEGEA